MDLVRMKLRGFLLLLTLCAPLYAQLATKTTPASVPHLVGFSGKATDAAGKALTGSAGITFAIYKEQFDGAPLWLETQSIHVDKTGNFTSQLGTTKSDGLPLDLFGTSEARWLGVRINGGDEQPRVLLLSVPYALKAADAQTLGGLPPSAFVLAAPPMIGSTSSSVPTAAPSAAPPPVAITGSGTLNFLPIWTGTTTVGSSVLFQTGAGATAKVGIGTTNPATTLDVKGTETVRGALSLPAIATATAASGKNSQPQNFVASAFNSGSSTPTSETFRLQAEAAGNNTANTSASLNVLFGQGTAAPTETGLKIAANGQLTFAAGQVFPGTGTTTSVGLSVPTSDFSVTGSPVTGSGTLALNWKVAPTNAATANSIVKRDSSGGFNAGLITAGTVVAVSNLTTAAIQGGNLNGAGISGQSTNNFGVIGFTGGAGAAGVLGNNTAPQGIGVSGQGGQYGVTGSGDTAIYGSGTTYGVSGKGIYGVIGVGSSYGVWGETTGFDGVHAVAHATTSSALGAINDGGGDAIFAVANTGAVAGFFQGNVQVAGNLSKSSGSFKIDHPLDPANKYLYHSFVESPDMKNMYDGNVTTDAKGDAEVAMPDWFEKLNRDFRYQLTVIGQFAQAIVADELANGRFRIKTDKPNVKVSWQVTGIRQDAWANAHRIPVEEVKPEKERGSYLHPELFGAPVEKSTAWARHPESMKRTKEKP